MSSGYWYLCGPCGSIHAVDLPVLVSPGIFEQEDCDYEAGHLYVPMYHMTVSTPNFAERVREFFAVKAGNPSLHYCIFSFDPDQYVLLENPYLDDLPAMIEKIGETLKSKQE